MGEKFGKSLILSCINFSLLLAPYYIHTAVRMSNICSGPDCRKS